MTAENPKIINWENVFSQTSIFQTQNPLNGHFLRNSLREVSMKNCMKLIQKKMTVGILNPRMINQLIENGLGEKRLMMLQLI